MQKLHNNIFDLFLYHFRVFNNFLKADFRNAKILSLSRKDFPQCEGKNARKSQRRSSSVQKQEKGLDTNKFLTFDKFVTFVVATKKSKFIIKFFLSSTKGLPPPLFRTFGLMHNLRPIPMQQPTVICLFVV